MGESGTSKSSLNPAQAACRDLPPAAGASEDQKTSPSFGSSTDTPRPMFVASTRPTAGLLARGSAPRPAFPAAPPVAFADETSRSQLRGQLRTWPALSSRLRPHRIPFSPSHEGPSVGILNGYRAELVNGRHCRRLRVPDNLSGDARRLTKRKLDFALCADGELLQAVHQ
jgi:hypothetical protein